MSYTAHTWAEAITRQGVPLRAIYADSFDPITAWHLAVIREAAPLFGELIILVTDASSPELLFSGEERTALVRDLTRALRHVSVEATSRPITEVARERGVRYTLRAMRSGEDPRQAALDARGDFLLAPEITPVFVPLPPRVAAVSSTQLKALARKGASLSRYCHPRVARCLVERLGDLH